MGEIVGAGSAKTAIMHVLDDTGDTKVTWDPTDKEEVKNARKTFSRLSGKGFKAFTVESGGDTGSQIEEFDPDAEKIIFVPQLAGG